jgi:hypothetical protein
MHWTGKFLFAWPLTILALVAMILTAKTVRVRNSWAQKIVKSKAEYEKLAEDVRQAQFEVDHLQGDVHRAMQFWGPFAAAQTTVQNAADGTLTVEMGTNHGIRQGQWLYGFQLQPDGSSIYRGDFVAVTVREGNSLLQPNWRVRPGDTEGWQSGPWRWRLLLPPSYPSRFDEQEQLLLIQDEAFAERQKTLADQAAMIQTASEQLKLREAELVGGPELPQDEALDLEYREGLVTALEAVEEERNAQLIAIDRLRRSVRELRQKILEAEAANRGLVEKLPQPPAALTRTK